MAEEAWTPYALEPIRIAIIRRRRIIAALILLALLLLGLLLFQNTTERSTQIFANGKEVGANGIEIEDRSGEKKPDHVTVLIQPGAVTRADTGSDTQGSVVSRASLPLDQRAAPYDWSSYLIAYGPYILVLLAAWLLAKRRGKYDEINFGVFKGAMPLEMMTASHERHVFTKRLTKTSVFGKGRSDHLPREIVKITPEVAEE